jgi:ribosomal protein S18 acetylase RimI-like enzyme
MSVRRKPRREAAPVEIQIATASDAALFGRIERGVFDLPIVPGELEAYLAAPGHHLIVALKGGRVIGQISAVEQRHPDKPADLFIDEIAVASRYRRRGIGGQLLEAMLELAKRRGCQEAWLATNLHNVAARALYERNGSGEAVLVYTFPIEPE